MLIDAITQLTVKVMSEKNMPTNVKTRFLSGLIDDALNGFQQKGLTSTAHLQKVSKLVIDLNQSVSGFDEVLDLLRELPENESKHSMITCMISLVLCEELKITHGPAHEKVALAALLHDIGLRVMPEGVRQKPRHQWTAEDQAAYELHPIKAVEMLRDIKDISNDVLLIVSEHHENSQGTGFPKKLRDVKISPLGKVVSLANEFSGLLFSPHLGGKNYSTEEALDYIENVLGQPYNKKTFQALKNVVKKMNLVNSTKKKKAA
jgi:putative nucleotidyltransferase with HDIG domain